MRELLPRISVKPQRIIHSWPKIRCEYPSDSCVHKIETTSPKAVEAAFHDTWIPKIQARDVIVASRSCPMARRRWRKSCNNASLVPIDCSNGRLAEDYSDVLWRVFLSVNPHRADQFPFRPGHRASSWTGRNTHWPTDECGTRGPHEFSSHS